MKTFCKPLLIVLIVLAFTLSAEIIYVCAETAVPTEIPTASPTPVPNIINSFGDFDLIAGYSDNRIVDENLSTYEEKASYKKAICSCVNHTVSCS